MTRASRRLLLWFLPAAIGLAATGVFTAGFAAAMQGLLGEPVDPAAPPVPAPAASAAGAASGSGGAFRIVALGDSLTRGTGDAAGGGGYPERVAAALRKDGRTVSVDNIAVDGSETGDFLRKMDDAAVRERIAGASLILVSIGGNDLSHSMRSFSPGEAAADPTALALSSASLNVQRILPLLRKQNPSAPIRILGLYNPFPESFDRKLAKETLLKWNVALEEASYAVSGATVVPTADLFDERPDRLSGDRFHPGPTGYVEIAGRVLSTLNIPAPAPRKS